MPILEHICDGCGHVDEDIFPRESDAAAPVCDGCGAQMRRKPSTPRPHMLTGADEKARRGRMICQRNIDYWSKGPGRERYIEDSSGRYDLTQLENTAPPAGGKL